MEWNKNPADGVRCLLSTRRVLDRWGHCCDYSRCRTYDLYDPIRPDRCLLNEGHAGSHWDGRSYRPMRTPWTPSVEEYADVKVELEPAQFRKLRPRASR
jgi:hypothetical protein